MSSTHDVLAHAIQLEQHHMTTSITPSKRSTFTPTLTSHVEFHQPMRLTAICEEEDDDENENDDQEVVLDVELEQVSITTPTSMDTFMNEPLIKPTSTSSSTWSTSRIFTSSSIPLPVLSWPSWLFLMTLMITQTCITCWGYATGTSQYTLYLPLHLLPSIILLRWWIDTASTPTAPVLTSSITSNMERLSPYDSLIRAYATGFILISALAITIQSTLGHMLLNAFITYVPAEQHHYYFVWVGMVSMILAIGEEGVKYIIASRVLTVNTATGNKLPIMSLTAGTLGCVTACSLFFTVADMFASTPVTQLLSFHYSLLAMLPVHCCTATFIGLAIAYRRLIPESWISPAHVLLLPIGLRLAITLMYFTYIMLFTQISHFIIMICQMIIICTVVLQLPYAVYQRYCVMQLKHVY